jgi:hypothetical protein
VLESWNREESRSSGSGQSSSVRSVTETPSLDPTKTELQRQKEVERALKLVDAAMRAAEGQLDHITSLPSARSTSKV